MGKPLGNGGATIYSFGERRTMERRLRESGERRNAEHDEPTPLHWRAREVGAKSARKPHTIR